MQVDRGGMKTGIIVQLLTLSTNGLLGGGVNAENTRTAYVLSRFFFSKGCRAKLAARLFQGNGRQTLMICIGCTNGRKADGRLHEPI